jgi:hypothetical protein
MFGLGGRGPHVTLLNLKYSILALPRHLLILSSDTQNTHIERRDGFYTTDVTSTSKYFQQTRSERYDIH